MNMNKAVEPEGVSSQRSGIIGCKTCMRIPCQCQPQHGQVIQPLPVFQTQVAVTKQENKQDNSARVVMQIAPTKHVETEEEVKKKKDDGIQVLEALKAEFEKYKEQLRQQGVDVSGMNATLEGGVLTMTARTEHMTGFWQKVEKSDNPLLQNIGAADVVKEIERSQVKAQKDYEEHPRSP